MQARLSGLGGVLPYAVVSADFEPLPPGHGPADLVEFIDDAAGAGLPPELGAAFGEGVRGRLLGWSVRGVPPYAVRVRLRRAHWIDGLSTPAGFAQAGRQAVEAFSDCFHDGFGPRRLVAGPLDARPRACESAPVLRDVHVRLVKPYVCGWFAVATADFEPLAADGELLFEFALELTEEQLPLEYALAFARGAREELYAAGDGRLPVRAFRVRLHDARWSPVDSNEMVFLAAGRRAAADALHRAGARPSPEPVSPREPEGSLGDTG
ncbi:hypothetical protein GCM10009738_09650 [Kitasatospora viridis]